MLGIAPVTPPGTVLAHTAWYPTSGVVLAAAVNAIATLPRPATVFVMVEAPGSAAPGGSTGGSTGGSAGGSTDARPSRAAYASTSPAPTDVAGSPGIALTVAVSRARSCAG